jgi:murein DD-endopeptidase MepM/ murein hydrolase activator NlpD
MIEFSSHDFYPVIELPERYDILDLSLPPDRRPARTSAFCVGRYNEVRPDTYEGKLFDGGRNIHMGVDIGGPVGTAVHAFADGWIECFGYNPRKGDYGNTVITGHRLDDVTLFALHGHLDSSSIQELNPGQDFVRGSVLGHLGAEDENGGWPPHLHFQLSWARPRTYDLPGVVESSKREQALEEYPDPLLVLGPLY